MWKIVRARNCQSSSGSPFVGGITFCFHNIQIIKRNIDITQHKNWGKDQAIHKYGQGPFCAFKIQDHYEKKGLYCFVVNGNIRYIGKVTGNSTFRKRINHGYGHISPYNCYQRGNGHSGGRLTNCRINSLVNKEFLCGSRIQIGFHIMDNDTEIGKLEKELIKKMNPIWNIQYKNPSKNIRQLSNEHYSRKQRSVWQAECPAP